nr:transposase (putative), gypsy type [Tanacetum cinerariifolium]
MGRDTVQLETAVNTISHEYLLEFTSEYGIPETLHPGLPGPEDRIVDFPEGKVSMYTRFFKFANFCFPLPQFLFDVLGWMYFSKRPGRNTPQCYTEPLDSLKNWNNRFFWVDERVFLTVVDWQTNAPKDGMPAEGTYSIEAVLTLDTHRTPIQKQPEMLLCLVEISRRYYLGDELYPTFLHNDDRDMDLFNLIRAPSPTKVKTGSRPRAPHEAPLLTLTATRVIEMDEPAAATDSYGVPSTIERSPLDFAHEAGASDQGTAAPEMPSSEDVPVTAAPGAGQAEKTAATDPPVAPESRSSHGGKSLAAIQLGLASTVVVPDDAPAVVSDPYPLSFTDAPSRHPVDVAQSSHSIAAAGDPKSDNASSTAEAQELEIRNLEASLEAKENAKKAAKDRSAGLSQELENMRAQFSSLQVSNECLSQQVATLQQQVSREEKLKAAFEEFKRQQDERVEQQCVEMEARLDAMSIDFDEELYHHMLTAIAGRRWVIGRGMRLAVMKCGESLELRQTFADAISAGIAKGLSEGLRHGLEHGQAQMSLESIEAYDPEAEAKFVAALQVLKDLKYPLVDQLESLKDAPMDVIMAALYLESDTGDDAPQDIRYLRPSSSQLTIPVYPEVRDPRNP